MKSIGFSTGAVALGDFAEALRLLKGKPIDSIELSALRVAEVRPLVEAIPHMDLSRYRHISVHAPSSYSDEQEPEIVRLLWNLPDSWLIIIHPDAIHDASLWRQFRGRVAIENMDRRKPKGRTAEELRQCFWELPEARLCFDIGHARQTDPSMADSYLILSEFADRLSQVHVSEVDSLSRHSTLTFAASLAFAQVARMIPYSIPLILESRVSPDQILAEIAKTLGIFDRAIAAD